MDITEHATISSLKTKIDLFSLTLVIRQMGLVNPLKDHPLIKYCLQRTASFVTKKDGNGIDMGGGKTVQEQAERKHDEKLLIRIRGKCLFSVEAHYHPSCRRQYTRMTGLGRSQDDQQRKRQM